MRMLLMAVLGLGLAVISTWTIAGRGQVHAAKVADAHVKPPRSWEYHCVLPPMSVPVDGEGDHAGSGHPSVGVLNHLGSQGWELVAIDGRNGHYCFKRQIP